MPARITTLASFSRIAVGQITASAAIVLTCLCGVGQASGFRFDLAVEGYCALMNDVDPKELSWHERGMMEGIAVGFVLGQMPGQLDEWAKSTEDDWQKKFLEAAKARCPSKAF